jgi:DNA polymerase-3 subunit epsilon
MICFFDTETSGLPNKKSPRLELQPHIMQLAVSLYDEQRRPVYEISTLVALPEEAKCSPEALETHGITPEASRKYGVQPIQALALLRYACTRAKLIVAHNFQFDEKLVDFARLRVGQEYSPVEVAPKFCTLEATTPILKLPPTEAMIKWGHGDKFKSPKLDEAYFHFFGEHISGAHDALVDTRACARVYYHLLDNGLIPCSKDQSG